MRNLRLTRKSKCLRALLLYHNDNSSLYWLIFQSVTPLGPRTRYKQEPSFMHRLCLKMTCPQELFIIWRPVTFDTLIYLLISIFAFYGSIMGIIIYLLPCWFKNWVISQWWMAHSFRRSTWPAGHFSGACRCCSRKSAPDTALALQVVLSWPLWWSPNSWAALWPVMCRAQICSLLTPGFETNQMPHAFNFTFRKALISSF